MRPKGKTRRKNTKPEHTKQSECGKRRHVFVSLINCNEFDSTGEGGMCWKGLGNHKKGCPKPQGDRKEPRCCFSCHPPVPCPSKRYPHQTVKGFCCDVARQMRQPWSKHKATQKNHLKYFANKFKSQTGRHRGVAEDGRGRVRRALPKQWRSGNLFARVAKNKNKRSQKWSEKGKRKGVKNKGKCGEFVRR